jgi:hypothetical protein
MKIQRALATAALALSALGTAHADQTWVFSYTGAGVSASGSFTTAGAALVPEDILSITGQRNGAAITGLVPLDTDPNFLYDNQFTAGTPHFTDGGMVFSVAGGQPNVNVYFFAGTYTDLFIDGLDAIETPITFNVTAVPEPATVASMMLGLGLLGMRLRSRRA